MTLSVIPRKMKARHIDTGEWHILYLNGGDWHNGDMPWDDYVHEDYVDEPYYANLEYYDSFEAA